MTPEELQARADANLKKAIEAVHPTVPLWEKPHPPADLPTVRVDPSLIHPPFLTDQEKIDAYEKLTEVEVARINYEKSLKGTVPLKYQLKGLLAGGIGGFLLGFGMTLFRGC